MDFAEFQVAFTSEPGVMRKVWLFSMVLGHSRWLWGRFCPNQTLETVMRCHITAFDIMGGVCTEILYDRMKTAVIGEGVLVPERCSVQVAGRGVRFGFR